jgi:hypothetical protein
MKSLMALSLVLVMSSACGSGSNGNASTPDGSSNGNALPTRSGRKGMVRHGRRDAFESLRSLTGTRDIPSRIVVRMALFSARLWP